MAATKAQLEQQITELKAALAASEQQVTDLRAQIEATQPEERDQLQQVVWLQREAPSRDRGTLRYSRDGETLILRFAAQYARLDKETGRRIYGERRWFTAIGSAAEKALEVFQSPTRLVRLGAYERPVDTSNLRDPQERRSEWIVSALEPMPRLDAPAPAQAALAPAQATLDEIPF